MSKPKKVGVVSYVLRLSMQDYEHAITYYNIYNDADYPVKIFNSSKFEVFGFLPPGFFYSMPNNIQNILREIEEGNDVVFSNNDEPSRPFFINKETVKTKVSSLEDILNIANDRSLKRKVSKEVFIYEQ
jgi:hypothetical protein|tara:strand:+ start:16820 stop:17206 length:387 start_codon:yes stop_codon:yes gene_type:complete